MNVGKDGFDRCGDSRYVAEAGHLVAEMASEIVVLHKDTGVYFGLNRVGKRIWDSLQNEVSVSELVSMVVSKFDAEESVVRKDVEFILSELVKVGLARRL